MLRKLTGTATFALIVVCTLIISACNPNSDAVSVLQTENTSLRATLASYEGISPTVTAEAAANAQKVASAQAEAATARAQVKELTAKLNNGAVQAAPIGAMDSSGAIVVPPPAQGTGNNATVSNNNAAGTNGAANTTAFAFNSVVTARGKGADGCASGQSTTFSPNDPAIWVIADVRNFKKGTNFTVKWAGGSFSHENDWTVPNDGAQICVHFYIEPKTLGLAPGNYTVTVTATGIDPAQAQFTVQGDQGAQSNTGVSTESASGK